MLRANDGALCIAAICAALSIGRDSTRAELRRMERAGLVAIDDVGRQKATVGYSDGGLVERQATRRGRSRSAMALCMWSMAAPTWAEAPASEAQVTVRTGCRKGHAAQGPADQRQEGRDAGLHHADRLRKGGKGGGLVDEGSPSDPERAR